MLVTWWRHYYVAFFSWLDAFTNVIVRAECLNSCCGIVGAGGLRRRLGRGGGGRRRWNGGARRQAAASRVVLPSSVSRNITLTSSPVSQLCTASDVPVKLPNVRWVNYTQSSKLTSVALLSHWIQRQSCSATMLFERRKNTVCAVISGRFTFSVRVSGCTRCVFVISRY